MLDAAAVEAALSLCEENGHALSGAWETGPFQVQEPHRTVPIGAPQSSSLHCSLEVKTGALEVHDGTASLSSLCNSLTTYPIGLQSLPPTPSSICNLRSLEHRPTGSSKQPEVARESGEALHPRSQASVDVKDKWARQRHEKPRRSTVITSSPVSQRAVCM